jgi:uncharacterized protein involved in exopolysaccharide biosynthesis
MDTVQNDALPTPGDGSPSLLDAAATLLAGWKLIATLALLGAMAAAAWSLIAIPRFRSTLKFALDSPNINPALGQLSALTGGLSAMAMNGTRSIQFYADVATGVTLLRQVSRDSFAGPDGVRRPLLDLLSRPGPTGEARLQATVRRLQERDVSASTNDRTGTVTITVLMPTPQLASAVATAIFDELNRFNVAARKTSATERRDFAGREVARARAELDSAERSMQAFLDANRGGLDNSPRLAFRRDQLQRQIAFLLGQYRELQTEWEQARLEAVRDTPVLTLVEAPVPALHRDSPRRKRAVLAGLLIGGLLGVGVIAVRMAVVSAASRDPSGVARLRRLWVRQAD